MTDERFDDLLNEMRDERAPEPQSAEARARVWQQILHTTSLACAEFRPEFGAYRAGELSAARRLLIDDHLARCAECRHVLDGSAQAHRVVAMPEPRRRALPARWLSYAAAAALLAFGVYMTRDNIDRALAPSGPRATIASIDGSLHHIPGDALSAGATLSEGEIVRTSAGSRAILTLADGSRLELNQRTELSLSAAWSGQTVRLHHGDVIVQAAKQRNGHLRVVTRDSIASVKGTIFAVSSGAAGSLVSVVEGSVDVSQPGRHALLTAGKQSATNPALAEVPVRQAFAWSQEAERYFALLAEFAGIEKQLAALPTASPRTEAKLLRYLPATPILYFAIPNLDGTLREALRLVEDRARANSALGDWWNSDHGRHVRDALDRMQTLMPLLGDEVVFVLSAAPDGKSSPLMLAQVAPDREARLTEALNRLATDLKGQLPFKIANGLLLISDSDAHLALATSQLGAGASSPFAAEIATRYRSGAGWLLGINFAGAAPQRSPSDTASFRTLGLQNARSVFFEQRQAGGDSENSATLSFQGPRTGLASLLSAAGPAASAEFISHEAVFALSASTRDPRQALEEIFAALTGINADLAKFESATGVNVTSDIAGSLGTDFTFAIERPSLPIPGWVAAVEVVRPAVLDSAVRRLVDAFNNKLSPEQAANRVTLKQESANGRTWMSLQTSLAPVALSWTYEGGYLVASTDRALAARAIATRNTSASLLRSSKFQQRFPASGALHHAAFVWLNSTGALADISSLVQNPAIKSLLENRDPVLVVLDTETERMRAISRTRLTSLILDAMLLQGLEQGSRGPQRAPHTVSKKLKARL